ncbi:MAG: hypothetical protein E6Q77_08680 [Rhizobium sp.]|nr:MAG: hypothetical protein E6Q77_08680 [Rhizobium sp.]
MTGSIKIARVKDIVTEIRANGDLSVSQQLHTLFEQFVIAARVIDPTITGSWSGYDARQPDRPCYVAFERGAPIFEIGRNVIDPFELLKAVRAEKARRASNGGRSDV